MIFSWSVQKRTQHDGESADTELVVHGEGRLSYKIARLFQVPRAR